MKIITSPQLPTPGGHYSQGVVTGHLLFVSGQLPFDPASGVFPDGIQAQFTQTMSNVGAVLSAAGATWSDLVNVQIFISDVQHWPLVNTLYAQWLGDHRPARAIIPCGQLHYGALVEITAIAEV